MKSTNYTVFTAVFLVWLFHLSAIIGISLGFKDWFLTKTPINLLVCTVLFFWVYPVNSRRKILIFLVFFLIGMLAEWLGANHGILFGSYDYGNNLGYKIDGVPLFIGINWALLSFISAEVSRKIMERFWGKALLAAFLMVFLDFFMEQNAPNFDFWSFGEHVPIENYITWFILAFVLQFFLHKSKINGNFSICLHLYLAQLFFFTYFTILPPN
ncbi:MAG: carotenoid biosynthesis protein [Bacteroidota bacterium]